MGPFRDKLSVPSFFPRLFTASNMFWDISSCFQKLLLEHILSINISVAGLGAARSRIMLWSRNAMRLRLQRLWLKQLLRLRLRSVAEPEPQGAESLWCSRNAMRLRLMNLRLDGLALAPTAPAPTAPAPTAPAPTAVLWSRKEPTHSGGAATRCGSVPDVFGSDGSARVQKKKRLPRSHLDPKSRFFEPNTSNTNL
jgi:hypothetical protein